MPEYKKNDFGLHHRRPGLYSAFTTQQGQDVLLLLRGLAQELVPGGPSINRFPSAQERQGNFSDVCPAAGRVVDNTAFPDCPVNPVTGAYFPNNTVPIDPNAKAMLALLPRPIRPNNYYNAAPALPTHWREELFRIDQNFSDKLRMFVRYIHDSWSQIQPTPTWGNGASFPTVETNFVGPGVSLVANLTANIIADPAQRIHLQLHHGSHLPGRGRSGAAPLQL